jgi:hypothetical protein
MILGLSLKNILRVGVNPKEVLNGASGKWQLFG